MNFRVLHEQKGPTLSSFAHSCHSELTHARSAILQASFAHSCHSERQRRISHVGSRDSSLTLRMTHLDLFVGEKLLYSFELCYRLKNSSKFVS